MKTGSAAGASAFLDDRYYQVAGPNSIGERVMIAARNRIYRDFLTLCQPERGQTILDTGVSDVITDGANLLERLYPCPEDLTAAGLSCGSAFKSAYPSVRYDTIRAGAALPYPDSAFEIAVANAVLEHVGSEAEQRRFIFELMRVARQVFITVPNRYFPVEHHTAIPLAHWTNATFRLACHALNRAEWSRTENLILMTRNRLARLAPRQASVQTSIGMTGLRLGPCSSNLYMLIKPAGR